MASNSLDEMLGGCPSKSQQQQQQQQERRVRPQPEQALRCPRCDSTNTKFCYYNNYSLTQPRYFCKGCRRYWTQGGSLRNVPVGGGCRKNKRSSSSSASKKTQDQQVSLIINTNNPNNPILPTLSIPSPQLPPLSYDPSDLTLAFARLQNQPTTTRQLGLQDDYDNHHSNFLLANPNPNPAHPGAAFLDILRNGFLADTNTNTTITSNNTTTGGFHNFYCGFGDGGVGGEEVMLPFEGGLGSATTTSAASKDMDDRESKVHMGLQWQVGGDGNNMIVDSASRDYWNGVGSSWHGLINSSLMR